MNVLDLCNQLIVIVVQDAISQDGQRMTLMESIYDFHLYMRTGDWTPVERLKQVP